MATEDVGPTALALATGGAIVAGAWDGVTEAHAAREKLAIAIRSRRRTAKSYGWRWASDPNVKTS